MNELWIPGLEETYDAGNVYDMMLLFQEQLNLTERPELVETWHPVAIVALKALARAIGNMSFEERQIKVATELAVVTSTEDPKKRIEVENVGFYGSLSDVHCIKFGPTALPSIALALDVESFFSIVDPDDSDLMLTTAAAPIARVQYIEREVA